MIYSMYGIGPSIKAWRAKKGIEQEMLARILGKNRAVVSRMEAGIYPTTLEDIERMGLLFELTDREHTQLLLEAGIAPTDEEVKRLWEKEGGNNTNVPVYLQDWRWFIRAWNTAADDIYGFSPVENLKKQDSRIPNDQQHPHMLELIFLGSPDTGYAFRGKLERTEWKWHASSQVKKFRGQHPDHQAYLKDRWYLNLLSHLRNDEDFHNMWSSRGQQEMPRNLLPSDIKNYGLQLNLSSSSSPYSLLILPAKNGRYELWGVTGHRSIEDARLEWVEHVHYDTEFLKQQLKVNGKKR